MTTTPATTNTAVGQRVELARYVIAGQERILYGQRIRGVVRVSDHPAAGNGRRYLVERGLEQDGYAALKAIVVDYVTQAAKHRTIPAAENPIERYLNTLDG
jgi:hypothetical protein